MNNFDKINERRFKMAMVAEAIDYLRIVPRAIMVGYSYMLYNVVDWYMSLSKPNMEQSTLVSVVVTIAGVVIGLYTKSGHSWDNPIAVWGKNTKEMVINDEDNYSTNGSNPSSSTVFSSNNTSNVSNPSTRPPRLDDFPDN